MNIAEAVVIEQPIAVVAGYAGEPSNAPEWCRHVDSTEWQTDPPTRLGSRVLFRGRLFGRQLSYAYEFTEYSPGEQIALETTAGRFPTTSTVTWRPVGDRVTHMTLHTLGVPTGFARLAAPFVARATRRVMRRDLSHLKRLLEST